MPPLPAASRGGDKNTPRGQSRTRRRSTLSSPCGDEDSRPAPHAKGSLPRGSLPPVRCAIVQPSYIPWRGYFDLIRRVDLFVFYDDVQYDRRGWRNRNRVKTPNGTQWLTIPVQARGAQTEHLPINTIRTAQDGWPQRHLETLHRLYGKAPHFDQYLPWLERVYADPPELLADFTIASTHDLAKMLGIATTRFMRSS